MSDVDQFIFADKTAALVIPIVTGILSAVASCVIIFIIFKSQQKLSTIYHRIMCGMSVSYLISCIAMSLTTLPMPRELPPDMTDYGWKGLRLGNMGTCQAQGFMFTYGMFAMFLYNASLSTFYTLKLGYKVSEETIARYIEPLLHLVPATIALWVSISNLVDGSYRPNRLDTLCSSYGAHDETVNVGKVNLIALLILLLLLYILISFGLLYRSMKFIHIMSAVGRSMRRRAGTYEEGYVPDSVYSTLTPIRVVSLQAMAYVSTFVLSLVFPVVSAFVGYNYWISCAIAVMVPSQGVFNALIFVSHKIYNYRRIYDEKSNWEAFRSLFSEAGAADDPIYISRLTFVHADITNERQNLDFLSAHEDVEENNHQYDSDLNMAEPNEPNMNSSTQMVSSIIHPIQEERSCEEIDSFGMLEDEHTEDKSVEMLSTFSVRSEFERRSVPRHPSDSRFHTSP